MTSKKCYLVLFCTVISNLNNVCVRMAIQSPMTKELSKVFNSSVAVTSWSTATNAVTYLCFCK